MTTASSIIQAAFREGNIIAAGATPTTDEQTEALERLNRYVQGVYGYEMGEPLFDWDVPAPQRTAPVAANYPQLPYPTDQGFGAFATPFAEDPSGNVYPYPPKNSRLIFGSVTSTAYLPESPDDGSRFGVVQGSGAGDGGTSGAVLTLDGNGRTIMGSDTLVLTAPITPAQYLYRADLGDWRVVADMALTDQMPFPSELDDLWVCALAIRMAPRYEKQVHPATAECFKSMMMKLKARYRQAQNTTYNSQDIPRTLESYISGRWFW